MQSNAEQGLGFEVHSDPIRSKANKSRAEKRRTEQRSAKKSRAEQSKGVQRRAEKRRAGVRVRVRVRGPFHFDPKQGRAKKRRAE